MERSAPRACDCLLVPVCAENLVGRPVGGEVIFAQDIAIVLGEVVGMFFVVGSTEIAFRIAVLCAAPGSIDFHAFAGIVRDDPCHTFGAVNSGLVGRLIALSESCVRNGVVVVAIGFPGFGVGSDPLADFNGTSIFQFGAANATVLCAGGDFTHDIGIDYVSPFFAVEADIFVRIGAGLEAFFGNLNCPDDAFFGVDCRLRKLNGVLFGFKIDFSHNRISFSECFF